MLIHLRVQNYLSLRDEQHFSLVASADNSLPGNTQDVRALAPLRLLKSAALYGANASGKSNVLLAVKFVRDNVLHSHTRREAGDPISVVPFLLDQNVSSLPSLFELSFIQQETRTEYGLLLRARGVQEEWLYDYPKGRRRLLYHRNMTQGDGYRFGSSLRGENSTIANITRSNSLFLSAAAQNNHPQLSQIYDWFKRNIHLVNPTNEEARRRWTAQTMREDISLKQNVMRLLKDADTGIKDLRWIEEELMPPDVRQRVLDLFTPEAVERLGLPEKHEVFQFLHTSSIDHSGIALPLEFESEGTKRLLGLAGPVFEALAHGHILMVDELESSLHELLVRSIVKLFHSPKTNPKGAQLVFTTHNVNLLDQGSLFRRDQIWFTEKDEAGATTLYPLTDYHPRKGENLAKAYLRGRYGGVPLQSELDLEDVGT